MASSDKNENCFLDTGHVTFLRYRIKQSDSVPLC